MNHLEFVRPSGIGVQVTCANLQLVGELRTQIAHTLRVKEGEEVELLTQDGHRLVDAIALSEMTPGLVTVVLLPDPLEARIADILGKDQFSDLAAVSWISLSEKWLQRLPASIDSLTSLTHLSIAGNQLASLPESFGQLAGVTSLHIDDNQLASLPVTFGQLTCLAMLSISSNQLASLPKTFGQLASLATLQPTRRSPSYKRGCNACPRASTA